MAHFKAGIPVEFDANDLFVYFESLSSGKTKADFITRRKRSQANMERLIDTAYLMTQELLEAKANLANSVNAAYGKLPTMLGATEDGDITEVGTSVTQAIEFLRIAAETERAKELKVLHSLRKSLVDKMKNLEQLKKADIKGGSRRAQHAIKKVTEAYEKIKPALETNVTFKNDEGDDVGGRAKFYDANFYKNVVTLFTAFGQIAEEFASEMADNYLREENGELIKGTTSAAVSSVDAAEEAKKRAIIFSQSSQYRATSGFGSLLNRFSNRGSETRTTADSLNSYIFIQIREFFNTEKGSELLQKCDGEDAIKKFIALVGILHLELHEKISRELPNAPEEFEKITGMNLSSPLLARDIKDFLDDYHNYTLDSDGDKEIAVALGEHHGNSKDGILGLSPAAQRAYIDSMIKFFDIRDFTEEDKKAIEEAKQNKKKAPSISVPRSKGAHRRKDTQEMVDELRAINPKLMDSFFESVNKITFKTDFSSNSFNGVIREHIIANLQSMFDSRMTSAGAKISGNAATDVVVGGTITANTETAVRYFVNAERELIEDYNKQFQEEVVKREGLIKKKNGQYDYHPKRGSMTKSGVASQLKAYKKLQKGIEDSYRKNKTEFNLNNYFVISQSVKMYRTAYQNSSTDSKTKGFQGFHGREISVKNFLPEMMAISEMAGPLLSPSDMNLLLSAMINTRSGTLLGANYKKPLEQYFSSFIGLLMFSDAGLMAKDAALYYQSNLVHSDYTRIHMYPLNNSFIPASMLLEGVYQKCKKAAGDLSKMVNSKASLSTNLPFSDLEAIANNNEYTPYRIRWTLVSEKAILNQKIKITFFKGFLTFIKKLFNIT